MSRQNLHKLRNREEARALFYQQLRELVIEVRKDHPRLSARKIHKMLQIEDIGINKFEAFVSSAGLQVQPYRSVIKTTRSRRYNYPNRINGLQLNSINQLWASDITYFITAKATFYIVLIIDVYSRRIIGYSASDNLMASNNVKALKMAFKKRKQILYPELIHHSDKGSQYGSQVYLNILNKAEIKVSMAENSLENAYAERVIGIIKNEYLAHMNIHTLDQLRSKLAYVVKLYNEKRPHMELGYLAPLAFEKKVMDFARKDRPSLQLYDFRNNGVV